MLFHFGSYLFNLLGDNIHTVWVLYDFTRKLSVEARTGSLVGAVGASEGHWGGTARCFGRHTTMARVLITLVDLVGRPSNCVTGPINFMMSIRVHKPFLSLIVLLTQSWQRYIQILSLCFWWLVSLHNHTWHWCLVTGNVHLTRKLCKLIILTIRMGMRMTFRVL